MSKGKILIVDDEASLRLLLSDELSRAGYSVDAVSDGELIFERLSEDNYHVVLLDIVMPKMNGFDALRLLKQKNVPSEVIILTGNATVESALECMKLGAFDYVSKPYSLNELIICIERAIERYQAKIKISVLSDELKRSGVSNTLLGKSKVMLDLKSILERIAPTHSTVLILGDSGSGKEVVARAIHTQSHRHEKPFVPVNCATFSETLLESELFGYEKGAFTDAKVQKRGLAEIADGGTLFLDEIGEIPLHFQAKLLRFLETGDIRRVGGTKDITLNVRIICATNQPLEQLVKENKFREDLFYRLNVLSVVVPPLKDRIDDIPLLVNHFILQQGFQKQFDNSAMDALKAYTWRGNVRELKNVVERTCILTQGKIIGCNELSFLRTSGTFAKGTIVLNDVVNNPAVNEQIADANAFTLKGMERKHIIHVLGLVNGHKAKAAKVLDISQKTLYLKMKSYNITSVYE
ncbi:MAG: sigma-54 dependent transcriptional regulator [Chitinispirillales bacterium]|jgi:DNA-binding NtrC family response regulator|nr:sigma-54 dependent transcriptional regulator [Chitinispirillales bacterium]